MMLAASLGSAALADDLAPGEATAALKATVAQKFRYDASAKPKGAGAAGGKPAGANPAFTSDSRVIVMERVTVAESDHSQSLGDAIDREKRKIANDKFSFWRGGTLTTVSLGHLKIRIGGYYSGPDAFGSSGGWSPIAISWK